jgi:hypothetical protein
MVWQLTNKIRDLVHCQTTSMAKFVVAVVGLPTVNPLKCNSCFPAERGCKKTQKPRDLRAQIRLWIWDTALNAR